MREQLEEEGSQRAAGVRTDVPPVPPWIQVQVCNITTCKAVAGAIIRPLPNIEARKQEQCGLSKLAAESMSVQRTSMSACNNIITGGAEVRAAARRGAASGGRRAAGFAANPRR